MSSGEEFSIGTVISNGDKAGYEAAGGSSIPTPTWFELQSLLNQESINEMEIMFVGVAHSDGTIGGTGFGHVTKNDVFRVPGSLYTLRKANNAVFDGAYTSEMAQKLLDLKVPPKHITGIIVRKLS